MQLLRTPGPTTMPIHQMALRMFRILLGVVLIAALLHLARLATRDCTVGLYVFDNCLWVWIYEQLGLPANKFLRAGALEIVGLALAAGIYAALRFLVIPPLRSARPPDSAGNPMDHGLGDTEKTKSSPRRR